MEQQVLLQGALRTQVLGDPGCLRGKDAAIYMIPPVRIKQNWLTETSWQSLTNTKVRVRFSVQSNRAMKSTLF